MGQILYRDSNWIAFTDKDCQNILKVPLGTNNQQMAPERLTIGRLTIGNMHYHLDSIARCKMGATDMDTEQPISIHHALFEYWM